METICHKTCEENEDIVKNFPSGNFISVTSERDGQGECEFPPSYTLHSRLWHLLCGSIPWCFVNVEVSYNGVKFCMLLSSFPLPWKSLSPPFFLPPPAPYTTSFPEFSLHSTPWNERERETQYSWFPS